MTLFLLLLLSFICAASPCCGNGRVERGEQCDEGALNDNLRGNCTSACRRPRCGDGLLQLCRNSCLTEDCSDCVASGEQCDDANLFDGDGCSSRCRYESVFAQ